MANRNKTAATPMDRKLRTELYKMTGMMVVLIGLGIYAHEFVIAGVMAKAALNLSIFAIFGVAAGISFRHVLALRNEVIALQALQVDFGAKSKRPRNPYARPAVVFHEPELLGQGYRLITEELGKQDDLQISSATVQTLLHDVDQRINDRKSTILYFSGLMVFLGLLGAFMGLMKTVHSVSDLIGAMDVSGKGGTDSFGKMIEGMKAPLNGMSVGFSSSLFGLMTSMVLGALERCMTSAMKALRNEFEHWLSNMAALEGKTADAMAHPSLEFAAVRRAIEAGAKELGELRDVLGGVIRSTDTNRNDIDKLTTAVSSLTAAVHQMADPRPLLRPVSDAVADLARNQIDMLSQFRGLYQDAEADRAQICGTLYTLSALVDRTAALDGDELHGQLDRLIALQTNNERRESPIAAAPATQAQPGLFGRLFGTGGARVETRRNLREVRSLRREVRDALAANRRTNRKLAQTVGQGLDKLATLSVHEREALARIDARTREQQATLDTLSDSLAETFGDRSADDVSMGGARARMETLRRRLDTSFEEHEAVQEDPKAEVRRTGTDDRGDA
jgi:hypothetical protein